MQAVGIGKSQQRITYLTLVICLWVSTKLWAVHIIGGDLSMRAVGATPGLFRIQLNQYWDATQSGTGNQDPSVTLLVFRKQNPRLIERIEIRLQEQVPLTFDNIACATLRKLSVTEGRYYATYQFDPTQYTDPGGYYMVWERCCRNDGLTNINTSGAAGVAMVFYLEFPPMIKNGTNFINSAPDFRLPNGDYICINKPFTFNVSATDADGDELRYSLVTPLNGYTTKTAPSTTSTAPRNSYPTVSWATGYGLSNIIPGNPALSISPTTGLLTVRATQEGLYLFTVQCEEFRNGERIGVIRRDFQLPVVDCSRNTPPAPVVLANGRNTTDLAWCGSQPLILSVEKNPTWAYQWQKDGSNLTGATSDSLQIRESGVYTVVKSRANSCANDTSSLGVKITIVTAPPVKLSLTVAKPYCVGDTLRIQAEGQPDYTYRWRRNGVDITGEQQSLLRVIQSGKYEVLAKPARAVCEGQDTLSVVINPRPAAKINVPTQTFCPNDSVQISAIAETGNNYLWQRNNVAQANRTDKYWVSQAGVYRLTVTAPSGCTASSESLTLTQYEQPIAQLDSIPAFCFGYTEVVTLRGQPDGGAYTGAGVFDNRFDPSQAGVGQHTITYTYTSDKGCRAVQSRQAVVAPGLSLTGKETYRLIKGRSVQLTTQTNEPVSRYVWNPSASLSQSDVASPMASPLETTPYVVTAVTSAGCSATLAVRVEIIEPLYIPNAFSPNNDGVNDEWVIPNAGSFPGCEVFVYNRWGELVFFSQGYTKSWDGTYHNELVPAGVYTYQIRTGAEPSATTYRGQLTILR
ncbi:hypothetical protein GCM10028807_10890 [Spirosoma daeguense]